MFKRVFTKCALSSWGGEGFGLPSAEKLGVRGGGETALFLGGYCNLRRTAEIFVSFTVLRPPWIPYHPSR
jgi:hypothetical protein